MPRNIFNWKFNDVESFLKNYHFRLNHTNGSHFYFVGHIDGILRQVCVPFHGSVAITPRTMRSIIIQSGIPKKTWFKSK